MKTVESLLNHVKASILQDVVQLEEILANSDEPSRAVVEDGYRTLREQGLEEAAITLSSGMTQLLMQTRARLAAELKQAVAFAA